MWCVNQRLTVLYSGTRIAECHGVHRPHSWLKEICQLTKLKTLKVPCHCTCQPLSLELLGKLGKRSKRFCSDWAGTYVVKQQIRQCMSKVWIKGVELKAIFIGGYWKLVRCMGTLDAFCCQRHFFSLQILGERSKVCFLIGCHII